MRKKILLIVLCAVFAFNIFYAPKKAQAVWPTSAAIANLIPESVTQFATTKEVVLTAIEIAKENAAKIAWAIAKAAALAGSQMAISEILDSGDGKAAFVTDWNQYLYLSPKQRTMTYMNTLFNQSTLGRTSSLNYEGIGQKNDQYLMKQYTESISSKSITVNLRDYAPNPDNIFEGDNFRGLNAWLLPQNNPTGIVMIAQKNYASELNKETTVSDKKQTNGFLPKEKNGRIFSPASLLQAGFLKLDDVGVASITTAPEGDYKGIAIGVAARIAGAGIQKTFGTKATQEAARTSTANVTNGYVSQTKKSISSTTTKLLNQ